MGALQGRVAIVTGAGRGIGRAHAHLFAAEGAAVVVNDVDGDAAREVAREIERDGGDALVSSEDVTTWKGGESLIVAAVEGFGGVHVLINNAGYLRDRFIVNMTEDEWDSVIAVHLKGHFAPLRHAAAYWRRQAKAGRVVKASVVNTTSTSGLYGNPGQANYGAAKAGIAALTQIAAQELAKYGVRVNAVVPEARTRLTESAPGLSEVMKPPADGSAFDPWDPANVAPLVAWLATESCTATGHILAISGGTVELVTGWTRGDALTKDDRWTIEELTEVIPRLLNHEEKLWTVHERPFGRYLEDFEVGDIYRHWPGKTITEYDDHLFCMITMNHHPLHTNSWFAEHETVHGRNVVVGNLVYSLVLGMSVPDVSGSAVANLEVESLTHPRPTFHGDTIYAETRVLAVRPSSSRPERGVVTVETKGLNQRGEEVCYFRRKVMVWRREAAPVRGRPYGADIWS